MRFSKRLPWWCVSLVLVLGTGCAGDGSCLNPQPDLPCTGAVDGERPPGSGGGLSIGTGGANSGPDGGSPTPGAGGTDATTGGTGGSGEAGASGDAGSAGQGGQAGSAGAGGATGAGAGKKPKKQ